MAPSYTVDGVVREDKSIVVLIVHMYFARYVNLDSTIFNNNDWMEL